MPVALVFVIMWLGTLILVPIAAIMGIIGAVSAALFIGLTPSLSAAAGEVTDFLADYSLSTLPLFLMMGSFAAVANISEDVYRLAHVLLGRLRGGLALATIAGCAGFGALTGHSISTWRSPWWKPEAMAMNDCRSSSVIFSVQSILSWPKSRS